MREAELACVQVSATAQELATQPACWRLAFEAASAAADRLPPPGERVAAVGSGTSLYIARAYAALREAGGHGETDAFPASEFPARRAYDRVVAISRSGTTTEILRILKALRPTPRVVITADGDSPAVVLSGARVAIPFADERSVVQTRFATSVLALLRAHLGEDIRPAIADAERALDEPLPLEPTDVHHVVFLGHGWSVGIAEEAALKLREASRTYSEAYPAMEYRHGPISLAGPGTFVWILGSPDPRVAADVRATGAGVREGSLDPMAELVLAQRLAVSIAEARGFDPDRPRHLNRSVVLS
jgi:fructoselysine-6-P-deglycase FrlB-like protein